MVELDIGKLFFMQCFHGVAPKAGDFQHVGFVHRHHLVAAFARPLKGDAGNPFDFHHRVAHRVERFVAVVADRLAEIDAARQLAHGEQVNADHGAGAKWRGFCQRRRNCHRTQIGKRAEFFTDFQQSGLWPHLAGQLVPLGAADRTEQDGVGGFANVDGALWHRVVVCINRRTTRRGFGVFKGKVRAFCNGIENFDAFGDHFRADPVAGQKTNFVGVTHWIDSFHFSAVRNVGQCFQPVLSCVAELAWTGWKHCPTL